MCPKKRWIEVTPGYINNAGLTDEIFTDDFESGDLTAWDSSVTDSGDLSADAAADYWGDYGLKATIDDIGDWLDWLPIIGIGIGLGPAGSIEIALMSAFTLSKMQTAENTSSDLVEISNAIELYRITQELSKENNYKDYHYGVMVIDAGSNIIIKGVSINGKKVTNHGRFSLAFWLNDTDDVLKLWFNPRIPRP